MTALFVTLLMVSPPALANAKPSDAYKQYLAKLYYARSMKDIAPLFSSNQREHFESLVGEEAANELKNWKKGYVAKFRVIKEEIIDDRAFIEGDGIGLEQGRRIKAHVRVQMHRENGHWKVMFTVWSGTIYAR